MTPNKLFPALQIFFPCNLATTVWFISCGFYLFLAFSLTFCVCVNRAEWHFATNFNAITLIVTHWIWNPFIDPYEPVQRHSVHLICSYNLVAVHTCVHPTHTTFYIRNFRLKVSLSLRLLVSEPENGLAFVFPMKTATLAVLFFFEQFIFHPHLPPPEPNNW